MNDNLGLQNQRRATSASKAADLSMVIRTNQEQHAPPKRPHQRFYHFMAATSSWSQRQKELAEERLRRHDTAAAQGSARQPRTSRSLVGKSPTLATEKRSQVYQIRKEGISYQQAIGLSEVQSIHPQGFAPALLQFEVPMSKRSRMVSRTESLSRQDTAASSCVVDDSCQHLAQNLNQLQERKKLSSRVRRPRSRSLSPEQRRHHQPRRQASDEADDRTTTLRNTTACSTTGNEIGLPPVPPCHVTKSNCRSVSLEALRSRCGSRRHSVSREHNVEHRTVDKKCDGVDFLRRNTSSERLSSSRLRKSPSCHERELLPKRQQQQRRCGFNQDANIGPINQSNNCCTTIQQNKTDHNCDRTIKVGVSNHTFQNNVRRTGSNSSRGNISSTGNNSNRGNISNTGNNSNQGNISNSGNNSDRGNISNPGNNSNRGNISNSGNNSDRGNISNTVNKCNPRNISNTGNNSNRGNISNTGNNSNRGNISNTRNNSNRGNISNTGNNSNRGNISNTNNSSNRGNISNTRNKSNRCNIRDTGNNSNRGNISNTENNSNRGNISNTDHNSNRGNISNTDNNSNRGNISNTDNNSNRGNISNRANVSDNNNNRNAAISSESPFVYDGSDLIFETVERQTLRQRAMMQGNANNVDDKTTTMIISCKDLYDIANHSRRDSILTLSHSSCSDNCDDGDEDDIDFDFIFTPFINRTEDQDTKPRLTADLQTSVTADLQTSVTADLQTSVTTKILNENENSSAIHNDGAVGTPKNPSREKKTSPRIQLMPTSEQGQLDPSEHKIRDEERNVNQSVGNINSTWEKSRNQTEILNNNMKIGLCENLSGTGNLSIEQTSSNGDLRRQSSSNIEQKKQSLVTEEQIPELSNLDNKILLNRNDQRIVLQATGSSESNGSRGSVPLGLTIAQEFHFETARRSSDRMSQYLQKTQHSQERQSQNSVGHEKSILRRVIADIKQKLKTHPSKNNKGRINEASRKSEVVSMRSCQQPTSEIHQSASEIHRKQTKTSLLRDAMPNGVNSRVSSDDSPNDNQITPQSNSIEKISSPSVKTSENKEGHLGVNSIHDEHSEENIQIIQSEEKQHPQISEDTKTKKNGKRCIKRKKSQNNTKLITVENISSKESGELSSDGSTPDVKIITEEKEGKSDEIKLGRLAEYPIIISSNIHDPIIASKKLTERSRNKRNREEIACLLAATETRNAILKEEDANSITTEPTKKTDTTDTMDVQGESKIKDSGKRCCYFTGQEKWQDCLSTERKLMADIQDKENINPELPINEGNKIRSSITDEDRNS